MRMIIKRKKGLKYNNKTVVYNGIKFVSKKEGQRYLFLKKAEEDGKTEKLELKKYDPVARKHVVYKESKIS